MHHASNRIFQKIPIVCQACMLRRRLLKPLTSLIQLTCYARELSYTCQRQRLLSLPEGSFLHGAQTYCASCLLNVKFIAFTAVGGPVHGPFRDTAFRWWSSCISCDCNCPFASIMHALLGLVPWGSCLAQISICILIILIKIRSKVESFEYNALLICLMYRSPPSGSCSWLAGLRCIHLADIKSPPSQGKWGRNLVNEAYEYLESQKLYRELAAAFSALSKVHSIMSTRSASNLQSDDWTLITVQLLRVYDEECSAIRLQMVLWILACFRQLQANKALLSSSQRIASCSHTVIWRAKKSPKSLLQ